ncbi:MAG: biopolymer transporter ExbD [Planctomycetes bacterium]|uniref:ExbD/TolR family protein n=1 Tax=uncultured Gimesia sp. TaxID=1678688 RepID=UPI002603B61F|nr:biopolymer transporter ExbD [uncultured Gimesia sp.]MCH9656749.1 biopolymer transporter ExbD [Planctomycetota bacterium]MCH9726609.1 biopolymer transporter ExbD [Planctomycetota bacterium]MCH9779278.1 biopolymer transporter ExbD [Planctomycetota bacterium]MDF1745792.1 biopolymer transporter ExbD [Gimesia sp.]
MKIPSHHSTRRDIQDQATMTPMIDVVFLLLIFFISASANQIREFLLPTELATGSIESTETVPQEKPLGEVWLKLKRQGNQTIVELNEREYAQFDQLKQTLTELASLAPEIPVILDIEENVSLGEMIRVYDTSLAAGFYSIHFATDANKVTPKKKPITSPN